MSVIGRDVRNAGTVELEFRDGLIHRRIAALPTPETPWLSTGWIDLQINGWAGVDYNDDHLELDGLEEMCRDLARHGTTRHLATIITASPEAMYRRVAALCRLRDASSFLSRRIIGLHIEGPFLSGDDGPRGAHDPAAVRNPSIDEYETWQAASGGLVRIVTLAPERPGALDFIRYITSRGVVAALGHTGADPGLIREAVAAGAGLSTHLGNGLGALVHRHENPLWEQIASDGLTASLIGDGHHLPAAFVRTVFRAKGPGKVLLVSDAAPPGGMPPGRMNWAGMEVELSSEGRISLAGTPYLAGAGLLQDRGVEFLMATGCSPAEAADAVTSVPGGLIGLDSGETDLEIGSPGDVVAFRITGGSEPGKVQITGVCLDGEPVAPKNGRFS